jgi:hypothetical protein
VGFITEVEEKEDRQTCEYLLRTTLQTLREHIF